MSRNLLIGLLALTLSGCGEPLVIIGDLPGFMRAVVGVPDSIGTRNDSTSLRTKLTHPTGLAVSKAGILYVGDASSRIFSVTSSGKLAVLHQSFFCFVKTCLGRPQGMALSLDEKVLYIADDMSDKIWALSLVNNNLSVLAGTGENGVSPDGTPALQAKLASPNGLVVLADGRVAFAERNANRVRVIGTDGILRTLAGNGTQAEAADGAVAASSPLSIPTGLAFANNVLYVSETGSNTVRAIDMASGTIKKIAGNGGSGYSGDGGSALLAAMSTPIALAVAENNLYIADMFNNRVRAVNLTAGTISTFAGTGTLLYNGNGRAAAETSIYFPDGLASSSFGFLYISDYGHNVVWRTPVKVSLSQ